MARAGARRGRTAEQVALIALILFAVFVLLAGPTRALIQYRRTGISGSAAWLIVAAGVEDELA